DVNVIIVVLVEDEMGPRPLQNRDRLERLAAADQEIAQGEEAIVTFPLGSGASRVIEPIEVELRPLVPGQDAAIERLGLGQTPLVSEQATVPPVGEVADQIPVIDMVGVRPGDSLVEVEGPP